jgi:exopolysaccharide production protein ExoQ
MIGAVVIILGYSFHLQDKVFEALGKSSDLTGRTFLWSEGIKIGMRHPLLGDGYWAFWVPGRPEAEAYWYKFDIYGKSGFHFHNLYIQTFVDLGIIGLLLMCALILSNCYKSIRSIVRDGIDLTNIFCFGFAFMYLIRAFVEVDFLQSFGIGTLLFFSLLPRLSISGTKRPYTQRPFKEHAMITSCIVSFHKRDGCEDR